MPLDFRQASEKISQLYQRLVATDQVRVLFYQAAGSSGAIVTRRAAGRGVLPGFIGEADGCRVTDVDGRSANPCVRGGPMARIRRECEASVNEFPNIVAGVEEPPKPARRR